MQIAIHLATYRLTLEVADVEGNGEKLQLTLAYPPEAPPETNKIPDWTQFLQVPITMYDGAPASEAGSVLRRHFDRLVHRERNVRPLVLETIGWMVDACAMFPSGVIAVTEERIEEPWSTTSP